MINQNLISESQNNNNFLNLDELKIKNKLIDNSINAIAITDEDGNIIYVNSSLKKMYGYKNDKEIIGRPIVDLWKNKGKYVEVMDHLLKHDGWVGELLAEREDKSVFHVQLSATVVFNDKKPVSMMTSFVDITEKKTAELKIIESDLLKTELINICAHELRTPITPIKGYISMLLREKNINNEQKNWLETCLKNLNILNNTIDNALDAVNLGSKTSDYEKEKFNITDLVIQVLGELTNKIEEKNLKLINGIPKVKIEINADKNRIKQVIMNLLNNAITHTPEGNIKVIVVNNKDNVSISVTDTGIGISKKDIPKLFNMFSLTQNTETRKTNGTGLGLYICKQIIQQHRGEIWAESKGIGKGTTFTFSIPK